MSNPMPTSELALGAAALTPDSSPTSSGGRPGTVNENVSHHQSQQPEVQPQPPFPGSLPVGNALLPGIFLPPGPQGAFPSVDMRRPGPTEYLLPWHMSSFLGPGPQPTPEMPAPKPIPEEADVQPWRWRGYPSFAKWMASDDDFLVLRRFGSLHARVALMLQDQLAWLEQELEKEDDACKRMPKGHSGTFRFESQWRRQRILGAVTFTLERYNHFVLEYSQQKALPDASTHQIENVKNWMDNANGPIIDKEAEFINHEGDLMAVVAHKKTPLRQLMDRYDIFDYFRCCQTSLDKRTDDQFSTTVTTNEAFIHQYARFFTIVIGLVFIIAPLWCSPLLTAVQDSLQIRLVIVTWLVVLFGVFMAIGTLATPFNTVGIITVYAAWLAMIMRLSL